jgi:hypothetical protein
MSSCVSSAAIGSVRFDLNVILLLAGEYNQVSLKINQVCLQSRNLG